MFGRSTKKYESRSPVQRGTSPDSIALRLTSPSARNGTARILLQFYLLERSHFSRRRIAATTRRSQKFLYAGNHLIQNTSARSPCAAATPKPFMLQLYRRFRPLPRRTSHLSSIHF